MKSAGAAPEAGSTMERIDAIRKASEIRRQKLGQTSDMLRNAQRATGSVPVPVKAEAMRPVTTEPEPPRSAKPFIVPSTPSPLPPDDLPQTAAEAVAFDPESKADLAPASRPLRSVPLAPAQAPAAGVAPQGPPQPTAPRAPAARAESTPPTDRGYGVSFPLTDKRVAPPVQSAAAFAVPYVFTNTSQTMRVSRDVKASLRPQKNFAASATDRRAQGERLRLFHGDVDQNTLSGKPHKTSQDIDLMRKWFARANTSKALVAIPARVNAMPDDERNGPSGSKTKKKKSPSDKNQKEERRQQAAERTGSYAVRVLQDSDLSDARLYEIQRGDVEIYAKAEVARVRSLFAKFKQHPYIGLDKSVLNQKTDAVYEYFANVVVDLTVWVQLNLDTVDLRSEAIPPALRERLRHAQNLTDVEYHTARRSILAEFWLGRLGDIFNVPEAIPKREADLKEYFLRDSYAFLKLSPESAAKCVAYMLALDAVQQSVELDRMAVRVDGGFDLTHPLSDTLDLFKLSSRVQRDELFAERCAAISLKGVVPPAGLSCFTVDSAKTFDELPAQDSKFAFHANLVHMDVWPDRMLLDKESEQSRMSLILCDANHRTSAFYLLVRDMALACKASTSALPLDDVHIRSQIAATDVQFFEGSVLNSDALGRISVDDAWQEWMCQTAAEVNYAHDGDDLTALLPSALDFATRFSEPVWVFDAQLNAANLVFLLHNKRRFIAYTPALRGDSRSPHSMVELRQNRYPSPAMLAPMMAGRVHLPSSAVAGFAYRFELQPCEAPLQQFTWYRHKAKKFKQSLDAKTVNFWFGNTIELDVVIQNADMTTFPNPDWMLLLFKALVGYIREYERESNGRTTNAPLAPLLLVKLGHVKLAGACNTTLLCYFLRRFLAFGLACTEETKRANAQLAPDFLLRGQDLLYAATDPSHNGTVMPSKITSHASYSCVLFRPLPAASELWGMFLMFTANFWILPDPFTMTIAGAIHWQTVELRAGSSSLAACAMQNANELANINYHDDSRVMFAGLDDEQRNKLLRCNPSTIRPTTRARRPDPQSQAAATLSEELSHAPAARRMTNIPAAPVVHAPPARSIPTVDKPDPVKVAAQAAYQRLLELNSHKKDALYEGAASSSRFVDKLEMRIPTDLWAAMSNVDKSSTASALRNAREWTPVDFYRFLQPLINRYGANLASTLFLPTKVTNLMKPAARQDIRTAAAAVLRADSGESRVAVEAFTDVVLANLSEIRFAGEWFSGENFLADDANARESTVTAGRQPRVPNSVETKPPVALKFYTAVLAPVSADKFMAASPDIRQKLVAYFLAEKFMLFNKYVRDNGLSRVGNEVAADERSFRPDPPSISRNAWLRMTYANRAVFIAKSSDVANHKDLSDVFLWYDQKHTSADGQRIFVTPDTVNPTMTAERVVASGKHAEPDTPTPPPSADIERPFVSSTTSAPFGNPKMDAYFADLSSNANDPELLPQEMVAMKNEKSA